MPKLTLEFIKKAPVPATGYKIHWDDQKDPRGYGLRVNAKGTKSFVFAGRLRGVSILFTIGRYGDLTEHQAREEARKVRDGLRQGLDPRNVRRRAEGITLLQLADEYVARPTAKMKPSSRDAILRHVKTTWKRFADMPIAGITEGDVRDRYDSMIKVGLDPKNPRKGGSPYQAKQAFAVLTAMMSYAVLEQRGITVNSCLRVVNRHNRVKVRTVDTFIAQSKIGEVWNWIGGQRRDAYTQADMNRMDLIKFLLLTGCRISEALELTWDRVNLDEKDPWWHLPDPKNRQPYWVPLSLQALDMLKVRRKEVPANVKWVFPSDRSNAGHMSDPRESLWKPISKLVGEAISAHDCRRSFTIYGLMDCRIEKFRMELLTTHKPNGVVSQHYAQILTQRLQWLRPEVQQIADWIEQQGLIASSGNVVPLRKAS